jgi:hypothetical protein
MTIIFPKNNLPEPAQPWAREVQKQLANVVASDTANEINNSARDNQLNSSLISLTKVVSDVKTASDEANAAINGLTGLGSTGSSYTINASNINAGSISGNFISGGTITGTTLQTAANGQRLVVESPRIAFYGQSNIYAGQLYGQDDGTNGFIALLTESGTGINMFENGSIIFGTLQVPDGFASTVSTTGSFIREALAGGGTTGASFNNNGSLVRTSSSERYKQDIEDLTVEYEDLLSLQPRRFRLKDEAAENPEARYYAGFIAEEINETPLKDFVSYEKLEDGTKRPDGVYYGELTAALLEAIKHQDQLIKSLTSRIEALESKVE